MLRAVFRSRRDEDARFQVCSFFMHRYVYGRSVGSVWFVLLLCVSYQCTSQRSRLSIFCSTEAATLGGVVHSIGKCACGVRMRRWVGGLWGVGKGRGTDCTWACWDILKVHDCLSDL